MTSPKQDPDGRQQPEASPWRWQLERRNITNLELGQGERLCVRREPPEPWVAAVTADGKAPIRASIMGGEKLAESDVEERKSKREKESGVLRDASGIRRMRTREPPIRCGAARLAAHWLRCCAAHGSCCCSI